MYVCGPARGLPNLLRGGGIKIRFAKNQTHKAPPDSLFTIKPNPTLTTWIYSVFLFHLFQRNLDCTMNTVELVLTVDDKLWTRTKMAEAGVGVPKTLAFAFQPRHDYQTSTRDEFGGKLVTVVQLHTKMDAETTITDAVREFVSSTTMQEFQQWWNTNFGYMCACATICTKADSNKRTLSRVISRVISRVVACFSWKNLGSRLWN